MLPRETWLEILHHVERRDLDWLPLVNRCLRRLIDAHDHELARRRIDKVLIRGPRVREPELPKWKMFLTPAELQGQRAVVIDGDGRRLRFVGTWHEQVKWAMKVIRDSHVALLRFGCLDADYNVLTMTNKTARAIVKEAPSISVGQLHFWKVHLCGLKAKHFANLLLSLRRVDSFNQAGTLCNGSQITDDFLRRAAAKGLQLHRFLGHDRKHHPVKLPAWIRFRCAATDDSVLDYLCNEAYPREQRQLSLNRFRASRSFLVTLIERLKSLAKIKHVRFEAGLSLSSQDLGDYADLVYRVSYHGAIYHDLLLCTEAYCAKITFEKFRWGSTCCCRYTNDPQRFDAISSTFY